MVSIRNFYCRAGFALGFAVAGPAVAADSITEFGRWISRYEAAPANAKPDLVAEGVRLAKRREPAMRRLIATQPSLALQRAVPRLARLPEPIARHLEQHAEGLAEYTVTATCGGPRHRGCVMERSLMLNGQRFIPRWTGRRAHLGSKRGLPVYGIVLGGQMAVADEPARELSAAEKTALGIPVNQIVLSLAGEQRAFDTTAAAAEWQHQLVAAEQVPGPEVRLRPVAKLKPSVAWTTGKKRILFIRVDFPDREGNPLNDEATAFEMKRTNEFLSDNSYGKFTIETVLVPGVLRMPRPATWYQAEPESRDGELLSHGRDAAKALDAKYNYRDHDLYIVCFDSIFDGWAGKARVGTIGLWLNGGFSNDTIQHEIGHNLGLYHANAWVPTQGDSPIGAGQHEEYGDPYDNMGNYSPYGHYNVYFKNYLSWIPSASVKSVSRTGTYRVKAHDHREAGIGVRALKIGKNSGRDYWIGVRHWLVGEEIMLRWGLKSGSWMNGDGSLLLDMTPETRRAFEESQPRDHSLQMGHSFHDSSRRVTVTPVARGGDGHKLWVDLRVVYGSVISNRQPKLSFPVAPPSAKVGEPFSLTATGNDPDNDALYYIWEFGDGSDAAFGKTVSHTYYLGAGSAFLVKCTAVDGRGGSTTTTILVPVEGSNDPLNSWTQTTLPDTGNFSFATFGDEQFLVGGDGGTLAKRDVGSAAWVKVGDSGTKQRLFGGALGQGTRLAVGWLGTVTVSSNDDNWRLANGVELVNLEDVIHGSDQFVAVGKGGKVGLSADGEAWLFHDSGTAAWLKHITIGGGQYVAVGTRGAIVTSANGTKWTERDTPTMSVLESVAFGNGRFVAVGFKGTILYSADGWRWLTAKSGTDEWLNDVTFGDGMFVTVGANGTLLTSSDGKAWLRRSSGTEVTLGGVAFGHRRFVIVGRAGLILESGRLAAPPVPPMLAVHMSKGGKPRLVITGQEGQLYRVETSTDLRRWKAITLFEGTAEPVEFIDETALPERGRFYRTVTP
ncbi:MAG: PKD domain-containing protein [Verrucomicrobiota bacterium]|nr:PKD domain-containing protein [Verrucomicrobiota bacterium]MDP7047841.1 PKD domain-containing protein [Verrucomicrobiota bacterium]